MTVRLMVEALYARQTIQEHVPGAGRIPRCSGCVGLDTAANHYP